MPMSALPMLITATALSLATAELAPSHAPPPPPSRSDVSTTLQHRPPLSVVPSSESPDPPSGPETSLPGAALRPSARFAWPLATHRVVRRFAPPAVRWGRGHRGVDLAAPESTDVLAPADGVVTYSGVLAGRGVLSIRHPEGFSTTYEPVSDRVATGTRVHRGTRIARLDAGHCTEGACLHWGYRVSRDEYRDPLLLLRMGRPILLPPVSRG